MESTRKNWVNGAVTVASVINLYLAIGGVFLFAKKQNLFRIVVGAAILGALYSTACSGRFKLSNKLQSDLLMASGILLEFLVFLTRGNAPREYRMEGACLLAVLIFLATWNARKSGASWICTKALFWSVGALFFPYIFANGGT